MTDDPEPKVEPSEIRLIARSLPRKRVALVLLVVLVNVGVGCYWRGCAIGRARGSVDWTEWNGRARGFSFMGGGVTPEDEDLQSGKLLVFVPPSRWSDYEWRERVWPWK